MKTNTDDDMNDIFEAYLNKIVEVDTGGEIPLYGMLIRLNSRYIALQRRDGRTITISRDKIASIQPTRTQFAAIHKSAWETENVNL